VRRASRKTSKASKTLLRWMLSFSSAHFGFETSSQVGRSNFQQCSRAFRSSASMPLPSGLSPE